MQTWIPYRIPESLNSLYRVMNGLYVFSGALSVDGWGYRRRKPDSSFHLPFNLKTHFRSGPDNAPTSCFVFGSRNAEEKFFFDLEKNDGKVYMTRPDNFEVVQEWDTLERFLLEEIERLSKLYDAYGKKYEEQSSSQE